MTSVGSTEQEEDVPICIAGMHRSGSSLVTRLAQVCGLFLGSEADLLSSTGRDGDGCWENVRFVDINDALLDGFEGGWGPLLPSPSLWEDVDRFDKQRSTAEIVIADFRDQTTWGWKDPRNSLTLPFWRQLLPGLKIVVCLRHPLDVALSLRARYGCSLSQGLSLWEGYNRLLLDVTKDTPRLVTHYRRYQEEFRGELSRLARFAELGAPALAMAEAARLVHPAAVRRTVALGQLESAAYDGEIARLYAELCDLAEVGPEIASLCRNDGRDAPSWRRRRRDELPAAHGVSTSGLADVGDASTSPSEHEHVVPPDKGLERRIADFGIALTCMHQQLAKTEDELARNYSRQSERLSCLEMLMSRERDEIRSALYALEEKVEVSSQGDLPPNLARYRHMIWRIRDIVREVLPSNATVSVISKGDEELRRLHGREAWHFPRDPDGRYTGYHPAGGVASVFQLEGQRAIGAEFLLIPSTALWWLDHYTEFRSHLELHYLEVFRQDDVCRIYDLCNRSTTPRSGSLQEIVAELAQHLGREVALLDCTASGSLDRLSLDATLFRSEGEMPLPYLDKSVDLVALDGSDIASAEEAHRVASGAVVHLKGGAIFVERECAAGRPRHSVSIVIPVYNGPHHTRACLESLGRTVPSTWEVEIVVVDDCSTDGTAPYLEERAAIDSNVKVKRNETNLGFLGSANEGAKLAAGEMLIFLNNDTVLLPGWLQALTRTFLDFPDAGAVGGRLVYPDGRLQEAGGVVFDDASAAKLGYGDDEADHPLYTFVRPADYCSGALLATPRELFFEIGGFDPRYGFGFYEDTDYCFAVQSRGRQVYYQPESTIIHVEGGTAGTDLTRGQKRHQVINQAVFADKWADRLVMQLARPASLDRSAWQALVVHQAALRTRKVNNAT